MSGYRDGSETPDTKFILSKFVSTVSLTILVGAGLLPGTGFAFKEPVESPLQSELKPFFARSHDSWTDSNIYEWTVSPRVVAQASSESLKIIRERYEQTVAEIDAYLAAWELRRSVVFGFDQSLEFILESRGKAIDAFFDADYAEAIRLVDQALEEAKQVHQREEEYYGLNLNIAMEAYEAEAVERAKQAIELAIALRPDQEEAKIWHDKIAQLPDLIAARQQAVEARNAGRLQDEVSALQRVLNYKPNDAQVLARIDHARQILRDRNFNQAISQGHRLVTEKDLKKANQALTKAKQIKPSHPEIARLSQAVSELSTELKVAQIVAAAKHSAEQDDWLAVQKNFERVLILQPQSNEAIESYNLASQMVVTQRNLDDYLARPHRLSSSNIAEAAREQIKQARPLSVLSPHMRTTVEELERELLQWQTKMPVRVVSDGKTQIEVRGVGMVGKVTERIVHLRPGSYKFEGKRKGYRNKLVDVKVAKDPYKITTITIICDEPT